MNVGFLINMQKGHYEHIGKNVGFLSRMILIKYKEHYGIIT
jgi:hypothetical protein